MIYFPLHGGRNGGLLSSCLARLSWWQFRGRGGSQASTDLRLAWVVVLLLQSPTLTTLYEEGGWLPTQVIQLKTKQIRVRSPNQRAMDRCLNLAEAATLLTYSQDRNLDA